MPLFAENKRPAVPSAALIFDIQRRAAFEIRLGMRFLDADLEPGASFHHSHFGHGAALHTESDGESRCWKRRELDMRLAVKGRAISGQSYFERRGPLDDAAVAVIAGGIGEAPM